MQSSKTYYRFWGKTDRSADAEIPPYHLLPYHNLDVAAAAKVLLESNMLWHRRLAQALGISGERLIDFVPFLLSLHDIGKFAGSFQHLNERLCARLGAGAKRKDYTVRHDTLGYLLWRDELHELMWREDWFGIKALDELAEEDPDGGWDYMDPLAQAVTGHHGAPPQPENQHARRFFDETAKQAAIAYAKEVRAMLMPDPPFERWVYDEYVPKAQRATWMLAGLAVLADWIGSNAGLNDEHFFRFEEFKGEETMQLEAYWSQAQEQAREAVHIAGVVSPVTSMEATGLHALFPKHADHDPTPLQQHAIECPIESGPQLFILEDATGSGKTEGAVILSHRLMQQGEAEGTYVGLPTMATANAMHERLADTYRRLFENGAAASYVLAHSAREHVDSFQDTLRLENPESDPSETYDPDGEGEQTGQAQCAAWLADNRKKALLANMGIGTIDQALIGALPSRHQSLRLLGLGRSVLVVDEVHAYDEYVSSLLRHVLRFQAAMGGSAVLLSATLPGALRQKLCDAFRQGLTDGEKDTVEEDHFPLVTHVGPDGSIDETPITRSERSEHHVDVEFFEAEKGAEKKAQKRVSEKLLAVAGNNGCACWIRNTVDDAIGAWEHLREQHDDPDKVLLFHARFTLGDRQEREAEVLHHFGEEGGPDERDGYILVATQVVEQSLDLDFDYMVSDLAPIDLLIQRAGRLHRHDRDARPDGASDALLGILAPAFSDDPPDTWYADLFPKGKFVYPHAGHLWRTMKVLKEKGRIRIPEEARSLLDAVYREADLQHPATRDDDPGWGIPGGLLKTSNKAVNEAKKASAEANHNALHLDGGYGSLKAGGREWFSEKRTPTRLGDPTTTVRLARWDGDRLVPWADEGNALDTLHEELEALRKTSDDNGWNEERTKRARKLRRHMADLWQRSELTVRESKISEEESLSGYKVARKRTVGAAKERMPDGGKWSVLIVVERGDDNWTGHANQGHQKRTLTYTEDAGLQFDK